MNNSLEEGLEGPLVSVCVQTYQHAAFIRQCLDSILMQKVEFKYEIILGEDESTDGTREICIEYAEKFPEIIRLFLRKRSDVIYIGGNATGRFNFLENLKASRGKYIAICEGDDYWIDSMKLQKQVNFLQLSTEHVLCFHKVKILELDGAIVEDDLTRVPVGYESIEILAAKGNYIHTPSVIFKNVIDEYPEEFYKSSVGDFFLYMMLAQSGKFMYIDETMAIYRKKRWNLV